MLATKTDDEQKALQLCQTKVRAKKLPMEVIDAEYQWFVLSSIFVLHFEFTFCDFVMQGSPKVDFLLHRRETDRFQRIS